MKYGVITERKLPKTDAEKANAVMNMIEELLRKNTPNFDGVQFIVTEDPFKIRVGMKWELLR